MRKSEDRKLARFKKQIARKTKRHDKRNEKYTKLYGKHEDIKYETSDKILAGEMTQKEVDKVSKKLGRMRNRMGRIERRDTRAGERLMKKIKKNETK